MNHINRWNTITKIANRLNDENIAYQYVEETALFIQGISGLDKDDIDIHIQWDSLDAAYLLFSEYHPTEIEKDVTKALFSFYHQEHFVKVTCFFNTTIRTDPYRISIDKDNTTLWCRSLYGYLYDPTSDEKIKHAAHSYLHEKQHDITANNNQAWNQNNYQALLNRYGNPSEVVHKIKENPEWRLHPFYKYMGDVKSKNVLHLMGSNGVKGVALSIIGAKVTIVDFSKENERFATELAKEAGVSLHYVVADVLNLPEKVTSEKYDIVLMELGVLHYFLDLLPLFQTVDSLLSKGGQFILHEFHPISTKLITSSGKKHKVTGNYFNPTIESSSVAFSKHMNDVDQTELTEVRQRKWTIGEVITAVGQTELKITTLEEEPNHKIHDIGLPKTYTLVAKR
ncbi:class I SAM-dependent methyltransferase [Neobacillus sp. D3-1R]|uniref:class I SAM-dependent methyltransferase n=1 Tax=Neobacillus sp. D3-1R TaxID=3445778 RepID=UPI003FA09EA4